MSAPLCAMLGFRFCPRLRDFPDRRLVSIGPIGAYPALTPLMGKRIRADVVREHWGDISAGRRIIVDEGVDMDVVLWLVRGVEALQ